MEPRDCTWCGSAKSIEHGVCQVCLMAFSEEPEVVVVLPEAPAEPSVQSEQARRAVPE